MNWLVILVLIICSTDNLALLATLAILNICLFTIVNESLYAAGIFVEPQSLYKEYNALYSTSNSFDKPFQKLMLVSVVVNPLFITLLIFLLIFSTSLLRFAILNW